MVSWILTDDGKKNVALAQGDDRKGSELAGYIKALTVSLACGIIPLWQVLSRMGSHYIGRGELEGWLWRFWWMRQLLGAIWNRTPLNPGMLIYTYLTASNYPESGNVFDLQTFSLALRPMLGDPAYYNIKILLILLFNGIAGYALFLHLSRRRNLSLAGPVFLILNPYVFYELASGRPRHAILFPMAFFVLYLHRAFELRRRRDVLLCGLWLGISTLFFQYYGMSALFYGLLFLVFQGMNQGLKKVAEFLPQAGLILLVFLTVSLPFNIGYLQLAAGRGLPEVTYGRDVPSVEFLRGSRHAIEPRDDLTNSLHRLGHGSLPVDFPLGRSHEIFIPAGMLLFALIPLFFVRRVPWLQILAMLLFYLLSLGPYLKAGPGITDYVSTLSGSPVPLPYAFFFKYVPFVSRLFEPLRFLGMFWIALLGVCAVNGKQLIEVCSVKNRNIAEKLAPLLVLVLIVQSVLQAVSGGVVPLPLTEVAVPEFYLQLREEPSREALIELPYRIQSGDYVNYYQIYHQRKILWSWAHGSIPPKFPRDTYPVYLSRADYSPDNTFIRYLEEINHGPWVEAEFHDRDLDALIDAGYRYVVLHQYGCYLHDPQGEWIMFQGIARRMEDIFGPPVMQFREKIGGYPDKIFFMLVYDTGNRIPAVPGESMPPESEVPGEGMD